jgi:hypothetical protein
VPLFEIGGMHWFDGGDGSLKIETRLGNVTLNEAQALLGTGSFEAVDVANLGSRSVAGNSIVVVTVGARFPVNRHLSFGGSWDVPVTSREDLWKQRATLNLLLEF